MAERVHLTATFKVKPGSEEKVRVLLQEAQKETRKEKGCIKYDLLQDTEKNVFVSTSHLLPSPFLPSFFFPFDLSLLLISFFFDHKKG